jgi:hypothetical protein
MSFELTAFEELETQASIIVNLIIKYELAPQGEIIETIIDKLKNVERRKYDLFSMLVREL